MSKSKKSHLNRVISEKDRDEEIRKHFSTNNLPSVKGISILHDPGFSLL